MKKSNLLKIACGFLVATLLASCFAAAAAGANSFKDVKKDAWYYNAVAFAVKEGLMNGTGDGKFSPDASADRAMLVTLLYRMEGEPAVLKTPPFTDLEADWYRKSVAWAYANGIVNGLTKTTYGPTQKLTREQFATILYRYCKDYLELEVGGASALSGYPDQKTVSSWAKEAMAWANAEGLITGTAKNGGVYLDPQGNATRAQMATIFQRLDAYQERLEAEPPVDEPVVEEPIEKPCRFGGEAYHSYGTMGMESKHFFLCQEEGCFKQKEVPCTIRSELSSASCTIPATINYSCDICGYNQTMVDPSGKPVGHKMTAPTHQGARIEEGPDGEPDQERQYHLSRCQNEGCTYSKTEDCTIKTKTVAATCTQYGETQYTCVACNYSKIEKTQDPKGHQWGVYTPCETAGEHQRRCTVAGCTAVEKMTCTINQTIIPATCKQHKITVRSCDTCGYNVETVDRYSPLADHSFGSTPRSAGSKTHIYTCDYGCGATKSEACTITITDIYRPGKKGVKRSTCSECDYLHEVADDTLATMPNQEGAYKVITYNLKALYYDPATKTIRNIDQLNNVADLLKRFDADVIGLQEVDQNNPRSWNRDQVKELADALGYEYYYFCKTADVAGGNYGTAIISRYPFKGEVERVKYKTQSVLTTEERFYTRAVIEFPESDVVFYNTHLCTKSNKDPKGEAAQQFNELMNRVSVETLPTLVTGDFNLRLEIREQLTDHSKVIALGSVGENPLNKIDDIYVRNVNYYVDPVSTGSFFRVEEHYSDHLMGYGCFTLE